MTTPAQTAADLRVAAHVIETAGHSTGDEVDAATGNVCLLGGVGVATGIYGIKTHADDDDFCFDVHPKVSDLLCTLYARLPARTVAAVEALSRVIPDSTIERDGVPLDLTDKSPITRVWGWNDHVCTGGDDAITLCIQAAEKIEADLP